MVQMNDRISAELAALRIDRGAEAVPRPGSRSRALGWAAAILAVAAVGAIAARSAIAPRQQASAQIAAAAPPAPSPAQASVALTATGYVVPQRIARVGAKVQGRILRTAIHEGQAVKAGDLLFAIDASDQKRALSSAQARATAARARAKVARASLAEATLLRDRERLLVASGAATRAAAEDLGARAATLAASVEAADADAGVAFAEVAALAAALADFEVRAPSDGVAISKALEVGEVVGPGSALVELADPASLLVEADVPESRLGMIREGAPCEIVLDAFPDQRRRGEVASVGPRVNRAKATGLVKVRLVDDVPGLRPDMAARVGFLNDR